MNIKDEDLLSLHYQIEKAETKQKKLADLLNDESDKLKKSKQKLRILLFMVLFFLLSTVFLVIRSLYSNSNSSNQQVAVKGNASTQIAALQQELDVLKKEDKDIQKIKDLYLYRSLINKDTVYSVQVRAFTARNTPPISGKYVNALIYNDTSYYKMSLGIFETLPEAQNFRKTLIKSGFDNRIFIISYKDGKRLKIEDFQ